MKQKETLIGKKVIFKGEISKNDPPEMNIAMLKKYPSEIIFEGKLISGDGTFYTAVGLKNRGELVIDRNRNLMLFPYATEDGTILHFFEELTENIV